jgi:hypothetical protein
MNELRRRRADRRTHPIEQGHNRETRVTNRGGAVGVGGLASSTKCSHRNILAECSNWNICTGNGVRIGMYV